MPSNFSSPSILYVAFHYPPVLGSSGVHRTLAFTRHLGERGWEVRILTASLKAYRKWSEEQFSFIPENVEIIRAFARDVTCHFSWRGKYFSLMAMPDYWQSWIADNATALTEPNNPFGRAMTITADGAAEGGIATNLMGYSVLSADSLEQAAEIAGSCPFLQIGRLELRQIMEMG